MVSFVRSRYRDGLLVVGAVLLAAADIPEGVEPWQPWESVSAVAAALAILARGAARPWGVVAALGSIALVAVGAALADAPGQLPFGHVVVVAGLLAHAAWWRPVRVVAALAAASVATAIVADGLADGRGLGDAAFTALVWLAAMSSSLAARWRRQARAATAERTRAEERERIARDLHDVVAHHVSAIAMIAEGGRVAGHPDVAARSLAAIHEAAVTALDEMRSVVATLRNGDPGSSPRLDDLARLAEVQDSLAAVGAPTVSVTVAQELAEPPPEVVVAVHRIALEAVTNARRHARGATRITVSVTADRSSLHLVVDDDGSSADRGLPPGHSGDGGHGLPGMRERARGLGGQVTAGPRADGGWRVHAELPLMVDAVDAVDIAVAKGPADAGSRTEPSQEASR